MTGLIIEFLVIFKKGIILDDPWRLAAAHNTVFSSITSLSPVER